MERQTKLNNVSAVLFLLSLIISVFIFAIYDKPASGINENLLLHVINISLLAEVLKYMFLILFLTIITGYS